MSGNSPAGAGRSATGPCVAFDADRLERYLQAHLPGFSGLARVEQFKGGQSNPTYRLVTYDTSYVLRRRPPGKLLPSAHAVDRECRVTTALAAAGFPVPRTHLLCMDESVIGTAFYVMDYVEGRVFWDQSLPGVSSDARRAMYGDMNRVVAALHRIDHAALGLADFGRPGNYFARQIDRWSRQYRASETEKIEAMDALIEWLPQNIAAGEESSIVHGDLRMDNVIFHPEEPRIVAVVDWELSTIGHPLADFAYLCMSWHIPPQLFRGIAGLDHAALGIPSEHDFVHAYCERTGRARIEHWDFYLAYNLFRLAAILQGILARAHEGTAAAEDAFDIGRRARPLAELGWAKAKSLMRSA
jgi:aminoglycoside phosphotransferase (APT) family kinase protein